MSAGGGRYSSPAAHLAFHAPHFHTLTHTHGLAHIPARSVDRCHQHVRKVGVGSDGVGYTCTQMPTPVS